MPSMVDGTSSILREVAGVLERLGSSADFWEARMKKLFAKTRLLGSYFATRSEKLREIATHRGLHHVDNAISLSGP